MQMFEYHAARDWPILQFLEPTQVCLFAQGT